MNDRELTATGIKRALLVSSFNSERELALRMGVGQNTVFRWVRGYAKPSPLNMRRLSAHLAVSVEDLENGFPDFCRATRRED